MLPRTLTTAFLFTQFILLMIVYVGILALRTGEKSYSMFSDNPRLATRNLPPLVLGFGLVTLACLAFSQGFFLLSKPILSGLELPALGRTDAFLAVFVLDIAGAGLLMAITGGSKESPFAAVLFTLPALSIFLRESPTRFFIYTGLAVVLLLLFQRPRESGRATVENPKHMLAFQLVTLGCLTLIAVIGYATRAAS